MVDEVLTPRLGTSSQSKKSELELPKLGAKERKTLMKGKSFKTRRVSQAQRTSVKVQQPSVVESISGRRLSQFIPGGGSGTQIGSPAEFNNTSKSSEFNLSFKIRQ